VFNQLIGIVSVGAFTIVFSLIAWSILKATLGVRVGQEEELNGLDIGEHGMEAYSGFVKESDLFGSSFSGRAGNVEAPGKWET
jgi:Amt family ammonium transporter